jgi:hypothetical protein
MSGIRYVFGRLSDRTVLAELTLEGVSMSSMLNDWGTFRATVRLDATGADNLDVINATVPGACFMVAERDDVVLWDGIVWSRTYDSLGKDLQLTCRQYEAYADKVFMGDYAISADPRNIMRDLWTTLQAQTYCNLGINIPSAFLAASTVDLSTLATDKKTYLTNMQALADGVEGFDWKIVTTKDGYNYRRELHIGSPALGTSDPSGMSFEYPGNIFNYWKTDGITNAGTHMFVLGDGDGSDIIVGTYVAQDLLDSGFNRFDVSYPRKDMDNPDLVQSFADQIGPQRRPPFTSLKVQVKGDLEPIFGSYGLGDSCTVAIMDARHPLGFQSVARLVAWNYTPQSDESSDEVQLVFEGDELND